MLQYLRWLWRDAPRALRVEFLLTLLVIEVLALATMLLVAEPSSAPQPSAAADSGDTHSF